MSAIGGKADRRRDTVQLLATVQRLIQRLSIRYLKWLPTGWRLVRRWRGIIGALL